MDLQEAYNILGVDASISDEGLKAKHREMAFKFHPDRYKEDPNKLKFINEAFQTITDHREHPEKYQQQMPFSGGGFGIDLGDIFSTFMGGTRASAQTYRNSTPPQVSINISFKESVLGCPKHIAFTRMSKCDACNGKGVELIGNGCTNCGGFGTKTTNNGGGVIYSTRCDKCLGRNIKNKKCDKCGAKGGIENQVECDISVPKGVSDGIVLELQHAGNFVGGGLFGDQYTAVMIRIGVEKDLLLSLNGNDVVCGLNISLLEALEGCKKTVKTIHGEREITINKKSHHKDEVVIEKCGVPDNGVQRVILHINYPDNVDKVIEGLKGF